MEATKENTISYYSPILDDISIQRILLKENLPRYVFDLCILLKLTYFSFKSNLR